MPLDPTLSGRMERRLPIIVVVCVAQVDRADSYESERTYTDNISAHGARLFSRRRWKLDEKIVVTPLKDEAANGSVVYCQRLEDDRFGIGVRFHDQAVVWSAIQRYDGLRLTVQAK